MRTRLTLLLGLIIGLFVVDKTTAQVNGVNYLMKYNTDSCWYDCYIVVNNGNAVGGSPNAIQFNSQFSIVTLAGDSIEIAKNYNPKYNSTTPAPWVFSSKVKAPAAQSANDFWSVVPTLGGSTPSNYLSGLNPGDTVKLFSIRKVGVTTLCGADIRIFENGVDPGSSAAGMANSDFSNGFTVGSTNQIYEGNSVQILGPNPIILSTDLTCSSGIEIDLTATTTSCQGPLTYAWTGPASFSSTSQDVSITPATPSNNGTYKVVVTDAIGCVDSTEVEGVSKPSAGPDQTVCANTSGHLITGSPLSGTWSSLSGNPAGATRVNVSPGVDAVSFNAASSGSYRFKYSIGSSGTCTDTMRFVVNPIPSVTMSDNNACIGETLNSILVGGATGTWSSSNPSIASVTTVNGTTASVTGVAVGSVIFTFTRTSSGCTNQTASFTVNPNPTIVGVENLCIGGTDNLNPNIGGTWSSATTSVATVTNAGVVTAVSAGTSVLTYVDANGCSDTDLQTVLAKPTVNISGNDSVCIAGTTTLSSSIAGTWSSSSNLIATVTGNTVTGVAPGQATFILTALGGCTSDPTSPVTVAPDPTASINDGRICDEQTATLTPASGGTWVSSTPTVATVSGNTATAVNNGTTTFTFTNALGCSDAVDLIVDPKPTVSAAQDTMCVGAVNQLSPATGGTWNNTTTSIVSYNNVNKRITGLDAGTARLIFTESTTGCLSDTLDVEVEARPSISYDPSDMCVGDTKQFTPTSGGVWASGNSGVATIDNGGLATAIASGSVTFTFTSSSSNCVSDPSDAIVVNPRPVVTVPSDNVLCIGETLTLTATGSSGGTWSSSHPGIASVNSATGVVTAVSAGTNVRFTYTDPNGCVSAVSTPVEVKLKPTVNFIGPNPICINGITNVTSNGAVGTWSSATTSVALINNSGVVTGVSAGTSQLRFTQTDGTCLSDPLTVTVAPKPTVSFLGDTLCIGASITITASPSGTGSWQSNNNAVATITSGGVVTAAGAGNTTFRFISDNGNCPSDNSNPLVVNAPQTINMPETELCIGETMTLLPSSGGTWTSVHDTVATVVGALVTAVGEGLTAFNYVDANGCASTTSAQLQVNPRPIVNISVDNVCVGLTSQAFPSSGGSWVSNDPSIATIANNGLITAVSPGTTTFRYTNSLTTCTSNPTETFTVEPGPTISYSGDSTLCIGETANILPSSGGTWAIAPSFSTTVATITNGGLITAVSAGFTRFVFTSTATGCKSQPSGPLTVNGKPTVFINGLETICIGATTTLFPSSGGTWVSNNTGVATVVAGTGVVTGQSEGAATFTFTNTTTGCISDPTDSLRVSPAPTVSITGETEICVGGRTELSPTTGGTWTSNNPEVATVDNNGIVTSLAPGVVTFRFADNIGCGSTSNTDPVTVSNCTNPDFNATFVDVAVPGDVNTNDNVSLSSTYGPGYTLTSKPAGSTPTLTLNSDGTYSFISSMVGVYKYTVPVCVPPVSIGCPVEDLWITVVDHTQPNNRPVANVDFATTLVNINVTLPTLANDGCVVVNGCSLDPASVTIIDNGGRGTASVNTTTGDITYDPAPGETGIDTILYEVCVTGEPTNCARARQIITIIAPSAENTTVADDDFASTPEGEAVSGNVSNNDSDPEGDNIAVIPQSTTVAAGTLSLAADGSYTFTPAEYFTGPVDFPYTSFDDHSPIPDSQDATLHILVVPDLAIKVRVYLEGSLLNNGGATAPDGRPLMRDQLRANPFAGANRSIPNKDPYKFLPDDYALVGIDITQKFDHAVPGGTINFSRFDSVKAANLTTVFGATGQEAITDWVYVELRDKSNNTSVIATRSGLVQRDGDVVDLDGFSALRFPGVSIDNYYVVVRHRDHFGVMTAGPKTPRQLTNLINFTKDSLATFDFGTSQFTKTYRSGYSQTVSGKDFTGLAQNDNVIFGYRAMWGGDFDGDGKIKFDNPNDDLNQLFFDVLSFPSNTLLNANFDFAIGYLPGDFDMNGKSKYDNPNDDKNYIYGAILGYPLNTSYLSNFDFLIEQLP